MMMCQREKKIEIGKIARMENHYLSFFSIPFVSLFLVSLFVAMRLIIRKKPKNLNPRRKLPPGPPKLPLLGNLHLFICTLPHHWLRDLANKHGPLMHLQLGELSAIVISSPKVAQEVMKTHDVNFSNRSSSLSMSLLTYNCTGIGSAPYGAHWRQLRKICTLELLSTRRVQSFRAIREKEVADFIREIASRAGSPVNLRKKLHSLTYGIISRAAFGVKYKDQDDFTLLVNEMFDLLGRISLADIFPSLKLLHVISGAIPRIKKLHQNFDKILQNIVEEHRVRKAKTTGCKAEVNDLVDVLLDLQDHGDLGISLTNCTIKAVILDIFIGGGETVATAVEWAISEMLKNPRVLKKAQIEVRDLFDSKGDDVNEKDLEDLKYLKLVVQETLRLHPPGPLLIPREIRERCEIDGFIIPAKTKVVVNAWAIGRDPNYWEEAEKFYPERFLDSSIDFKGNSFEYIPFGFGRRICPGISFGIASIELTLAHFLYHFDWKFPDGRKLEDIDLTEVFGLTVGRKHDLCLVPIPYTPMSVE